MPAAPSIALRSTVAELSKHPDRRGSRVGFLSQHELTAPKQIVDFAPNVSLSLQDERGTPITRMRRGALWVETKVDGLAVHLITAHMKSKLLTFPGGRCATTDENLRPRVASLALAERAQEAVTLRRTVSDVLEANADAALLLLGDLAHQQRRPRVGESSRGARRAVVDDWEPDGAEERAGVGSCAGGGEVRGLKGSSLAPLAGT